MPFGLWAIARGPSDANGCGASAVPVLAASRPGSWPPRAYATSPSVCYSPE